MSNNKELIPPMNQIITEEWRRIMQSSVYFIKRYCWIQTTNQGKIKFSLYPFQEDMIEDLQHNRFTVINKSRQMGISTLMAAFILWRMVCFDDQNVLIIATTQNTAKNLVTKIRLMYEYLPDFIKVHLQTVENNKLSLQLSNGSTVKAVSSASDAARSEALSMLVIDEAAFVDTIDEIWTAARPTLATGGRGILLSTPNGVGNFFYETWKDANENPKSEWHPVELHWSLHPDRDEEWAKEELATLGSRRFAQEYDCDFIGSGNTVVDAEIIKWYEDTHMEDPRETRGFDKSFWVWEDPMPHKNYVVVADVARGDGKDYSAFQVFDARNLEQVAEYRGQLPTKEFGNFLVGIATQYNEALLVIENTGVGFAAIQPALDRNYGNLYYSFKNFGYVDVDTFLQKGYDLKNKADMVPGFSTTAKTRNWLISKIETHFRERTVTIKSQRLLNELRTFIWNKNGKAEADYGNNDDLIMSLAIGLFVIDTNMRLHQEGIDLQRETLNRLATQMSGIYNPVQRMHGNPYNMQIGNKETIDLTQFFDKQ